MTAGAGALRATMRALVLAAAAMVAATHVAATARAQRQAPYRPGALAISVLDTNDAAIPAAEVLVPALGVGARTDVTGRLLLRDLPAGTYLVVARRFGFLPDSQRAVVGAGPATTVAFRLRTSAHVLDTARVESAALRGKMADFERRRASGRGTFITRDDIDRRNPLTLADMLRTVRGLTVRTSGGRTEVRFARASARLEGPDCPPEVWVDGVRAFSATVDEFRPGEVEGIELYRGLGQIPAAYLSRTSACGLLLIWTRSPSRLPP